jgi:hypothetical protein
MLSTGADLCSSRVAPGGVVYVLLKIRRLKLPPHAHGAAPPDEAARISFCNAGICPMSDAHDASCPVHIQSHIPFGRPLRLIGMQAHAHSNCYAIGPGMAGSAPFLLGNRENRGSLSRAALVWGTALLLFLLQRFALPSACVDANETTLRQAQAGALCPEQNHTQTGS